MMPLLLLFNLLYPLTCKYVGSTGGRGSCQSTKHCHKATEITACFCWGGSKAAAVLAAIMALIGPCDM